jgi:hypothetical protein
MSKKLTKIPEKRVATRTMQSSSFTLFGLPIPTRAQHEAAMKAMKPFLDIFQAAVDAQTEADLGIKSRTRLKDVPMRPRRNIMVKWFCDVCGLEIVAPAHPTCVAAYTCPKNREDSDFGWGESDDIIKVFCHDECAGILDAEIKGALDNAKRVVRNNA